MLTSCHAVISCSCDLFDFSFLYRKTAHRCGLEHLQNEEVLLYIFMYDFSNRNRERLHQACLLLLRMGMLASLLTDNFLPISQLLVNLSVY